jgi:three-Cys-motif partner protein
LNFIGGNLVIAYHGREQTEAKHFILRRYLQALAFKVLRAWDITYVDGFSGPWKSKSADLSDTSFMIAINVLKDAQRLVHEQTGTRRKIHCFFAENNSEAFRQLQAAVQRHNRPEQGFEIKTYLGDFEDATADIKAFVGSSFPLIFIDPTGWKGYRFDKIKPLFEAAKCEVLINFMYAFVSRFVASRDESTIASLGNILGGPGWGERLDKSLPLGAAVEKLFRETLQTSGGFGYVVSTRIDKSTEDRPHFFIAYGTKSRHGLKAFRQTEYDALRAHARKRADAKERKREHRTKSRDLFAEEEADRQEASIDDIVDEQKALAAKHLTAIVSDKQPHRFLVIVDTLLQAFMLRESNVKDICCDLARDGIIRNTWGSGNRKPNDKTVIQT